MIEYIEKILFLGDIRMNEVAGNDRLEKKCFEIMNFASGAFFSLCSASLYVKEGKRVTQLKEEVDDFLQSILKDSSFMNQGNFSYITILYTIYYFEKELTEETFSFLTSSLIERKQPIYSNFSPMIYLLQTERELKSNTIRKISEKIEREDLEKEIEQHARAPYDFAYFFLRRGETPKDVVKKYLKKYDFLPFSILKTSLEEFIDDFNSDLQDQQITDISQIKGNKNLEWDYQYYQVMQEYVSKREAVKEKIKK